LTQVKAPRRVIGLACAGGEAAADKEAGMKVKEIMAPDVETVRSNQTVKDIAERMVRQGIGYFPVSDRGRLVGVITDRDIVCRVVVDGRDPVATKVREVMSKAVAYCFDEDDLVTAVQLMEQNRIRRMPVLDREQRLVGVLSLTDVARHAPHRLTAELVEAVTRDTPLSVTINPAADLLR
jgi:CBS domain-containing protein